MKQPKKNEEDSSTPNQVCTTESSSDQKPVETAQETQTEDPCKITKTASPLPTPQETKSTNNENDTNEAESVLATSLPSPVEQSPTPSPQLHAGNSTAISTPPQQLTTKKTCRHNLKCMNAQLSWRY